MTRTISVGGITIGGGAPVVIQSMLNTKTVDIDVINHAIESGVKVIGENRVQEFLSK